MEALREQRGLPWLDDLGRDLRHGLRALRSSPAFTAVALLTLAIGIGAGTAIFSLVNTVLLRPLPVADPARLVVLWEDVTAAGFPRNTPAPANYVDWKAQNQTFEDIAAASWQTFNLTGSGEPERLTGLRVTANFLTLLGVKPALGRLMLPTEDGPETGSVAVISHGLWQRKFGSDPNLVGRSLNLNGQPYTVVGVAPNGFQFPATGANVWIAPAFTPREIAQRGSHYLFVIGRLKVGVSLNQARADMATIANRLEDEYPQTNKGVGVTVVPLRDHYVGDLRLALNLLLAAVGALLLIACANLAHLFLARGAMRHREIAMRAALGAGRARITRQLLTESHGLDCRRAWCGVIHRRVRFPGPPDSRKLS
jgi:putative ABC transport system permease protein